MDGLNVWHILIYLGAAQGVFLTIVFLFSEKYDRTSTKFLALAIFSCAVLNFGTPSYHLCLQCIYPLFEFMPLNWSIVVPFALYYFIQYLLKDDYQWSRKDWGALLPVLLYGIFALSFFAYAIVKGVEGTNSRLHQTGNDIFEAIALLYLCIVSYLIFRKFKFFDKRLYDQYSNIESKSLNWLRKVLIGVVILAFLWTLSVLNETFQWYPISLFSYPVMIGLSAIIYWVGYTMYLRKDLFEVDEGVVSLQDNLAVEKNNISNKAKDHYQNLLNVITSKKLFLDQELRMSTLALETGLSNGYLSQIINQMEGKNFFDFINSYRVEEVIRLMKDPKFSHFSLLGLAQEAGFKSKSTFNPVFKRTTGQTPSAFRKQLLST
jgi:AraC-like DNA-binding protein